MRTERNLRILAIVAIVLAVGGLSIGFASFSQVLSISNTTATVTPANFEVVFNNLQPTVEVGSAIGTNPTFTPGTTIMEDIDITLQNPGDSVTYTFDIENTGTMNAILQTFDMADNTSVDPADRLTCTGSLNPNGATDATNVCGALTYTLKYADDSVVAANDTLDAGETKTVNLTLTYDPADSALLPVEAVSVSGLDINLTYIQNR